MITPKPTWRRFLLMKKLLNTLYLIRQECYLHKEGATIVIKQGNEKIAQYPLLSIGSIVCFGNIMISPSFMAFCTENGVSIVYYSIYGRFLARVVGKITGNVLLRREQYRWADNINTTISIARLFVLAKISNCRSVLLREIRNYGDNEQIVTATNLLFRRMKKVKSASSYDELLGMEGDAATIYFSVFKELIKVEEFTFNGRVRRPPTDAVNALLSFVYSLITQECVSALYGVGLDPYVGFLHKDRPGRTSLALDLVEEFRAFWADRFVLTLINRRQIQMHDFEIEATGAYRLTEEGRKKLLTAYQEKKYEELQHPYLKEHITIGLLPHCQALLLARHLRGDTQYYTPFLVK